MEQVAHSEAAADQARTDTADHTLDWVASSAAYADSLLVPVVVILAAHPKKVLVLPPPDAAALNDSVAFLADEDYAVELIAPRIRAAYLMVVAVAAVQNSRSHLRSRLLLRLQPQRRLL